jgi:hypothetical protein
MTFQLSTSSSIQSTAVIDQTQSPIWNEKFHFAVVDPARAVLIGTVKNRGIIGGDTPLAKIELPICHLIPYQVTEMWYHMQLLSGQRSHPTVHIVLQAAPPGHPAFVPMQVAPAPPGPMGPCAQGQARPYRV